VGNIEPEDGVSVLRHPAWQMKAVNHILLAWTATVLSTCVVSAATPEEFVLKVSLYPGGPTAIQTRVVPQRPFDSSNVFNGERITIKGLLAAKQGDHYHLGITVAEWKSEKINQSQTCELDLTPGKVEYFPGFISSIVYMKTILLIPISKERQGQ
jgi:hypothetical protein